MTDDLYYRKMESTSTTDLVDMIRERDGHIAELEAEIQNLEGIKLAQETALSKEFIIEEQLQKENAELKSIADFQTSSNTNRYFQLKRSKEQLIKAKAIIRDYKIVVEGDHTTVCGVPEENRCINVLKLNEQAEQFLKEV